MVFALEDQIWRHYKAVAADILDCCSLFLIAWLKNLVSAFLIGICDNYTTVDDAYYEAGLVEVVEVCVVDCVLCVYVVY